MSSLTRRLSDNQLVVKILRDQDDATHDDFGGAIQLDYLGVQYGVSK